MGRRSFLIDTLEDLKLAFGAVIRRRSTGYGAEMTVEATLTSEATLKRDIQYRAFALGEQRLCVLHSQTSKKRGIVEAEVLRYAMGKIVGAIAHLICQLSKGKGILEIGVHIRDYLIQYALFGNSLGKAHLRSEVAENGI